MMTTCHTFCGYCGMPNVSDSFCDDVCAEEYIISELSAEHALTEPINLSNVSGELTDTDVLGMLGSTADARAREHISKELFAAQMTHSGVWELHAWISFRQHTAGITISRSVNHIIAGAFKSIPRLFTIHSFIGHPRIFKQDKERLMSYMFKHTNDPRYLSKEAASVFVF